MEEAERRAVFQARLPAATGRRPLQVTAIDAETGDFVVFDAAGVGDLFRRRKRSPDLGCKPF